MVGLGTVEGLTPGEGLAPGVGLGPGDGLGNGLVLTDVNRTLLGLCN